MQLTAQHRALVFWAVCIPTRLMIARYASRDSVGLRAFSLLIGGRWISGLENGNEGVFGGPSWWAKERPFHGLLWFAYGMTGESMYLYADAAAGAANWLLKF